MAIIKADLEGSVRLAEISADQLTVAHVRRHLGEVFDVPMLEGFDLYYVADGEELVLIDSDEEFLAGLCENGSPFRVTIVQEHLGMQSLVSCGMSLVDEEQPALSDEAEAVPSPHSVVSAASAPAEMLVEMHKLHEYELEEDDDDDDDDDESVLDENAEDSDDDDDEDDDADDVRGADKTTALSFAPSGTDTEEEVAEAPAAASAPPLAEAGKRGKRAEKQKQKEAKRAKKANREQSQLDDEQLFALATERLRNLSPALAELQSEQLRAFVDILQFQFAKLVKAGILTAAEVGPSAKKFKHCNPEKQRKKNKKTIDLPVACIEALRNAGLVADDSTITALVNTIRVQPKRFRKLGLIGSTTSSSDCEAKQTEEQRQEPRRCGRMHGRREWHHAREEPLVSDEEWEASLPENSDLLFEQAALRTGVEVSGAELKQFMGLLKLPFNSLESAGLLSEMEVRGDGTGNDKLVDSLPKMNPGLSYRAAHHAPKIAEALQGYELRLTTETVQRLMEVLRIRPCLFLRAGILEASSWQQQREQLRAKRAQQSGGMGGVGRWFAHMLGMSDERESAHHHGHPHHHGHHPHHHGHHHGHPHHHHAHHHPHAHHFHHHPHHHAQSAPATPATATAAGFDADVVLHAAPTSASCVAQARPTHPGLREAERHFPTNASMAQLVAVEGRQPGKVVSSGVRFEQRWKVQNNHTHPWPTVVEIVPDNEDAVALGISEPVAVTIRVQPQQSVDIAIVMGAPTAPGLYRPRFRLRDGTTALAFGQRLAGEVLVVDPNQPQQHEPQLPPRPQHGGMRRRMNRGTAGGADY